MWGALVPSDEEYSVVIHGVEPSLVDVGSVYGDDAVRLQIQGATNRDIVGLAIADGDKIGSRLACSSPVIMALWWPKLRDNSMICICGLDF